MNLDEECLHGNDGTEFMLQVERVRGEPPFRWIMRRDVGTTRFVRDGIYDGSYRKDTAIRRLYKRVQEWNENL